MFSLCRPTCQCPLIMLLLYVFAVKPHIFAQAIFLPGFLFVLLIVSWIPKVELGGSQSHCCVATNAYNDLMYDCYMVWVSSSIVNFLKSGVTSCYWRDSECPTLKYSAMEYWLFWAEGTWETADAARSLWPSPFYLKAGITFPMTKVTSLYGEEHITWLGVNTEMDLYKQTQ